MLPFDWSPVIYGYQLPTSRILYCIFFIVHITGLLLVSDVFPGGNHILDFAISKISEVFNKIGFFHKLTCRIVFSLPNTIVVIAFGMLRKHMIVIPINS